MASQLYDYRKKANWAHLTLGLCNIHFDVVGFVRVFPFFSSEYPLCNTNDFTCSDHQCIPYLARCDLIQDCYTGSDEAMCGKTINLCMTSLLCFWTDYVLQLFKEPIHPLVCLPDSKSTIRPKCHLHLVQKQRVSSNAKDIINSTIHC